MRKKWILINHDEVLTSEELLELENITKSWDFIDYDDMKKMLSLRIIF